MSDNVTTSPAPEPDTRPTWLKVASSQTMQGIFAQAIVMIAALAFKKNIDAATSEGVATAIVGLAAGASALYAAFGRMKASGPITKPVAK